MAVLRHRPRRRARPWFASAAVLALGIGGWWLAGPRLPRPPRSTTAGGAEVVLAPAERARRDAAIALAREPGDDPWTLAERLAPLPAASTPKPERCGADEGPSFVPPPDFPGSAPAEPPRPAGPHYAAAVRRIDGALRASTDPFDRAVADWLDADETLTPPERMGRLVEDAVSTADARVYALAFRTCQSARDVPAGGPCDALSARRWAELDRGNALPWVYVYAQARQDGDVSAQQEAMTRMAAADRFEDRFFAAAGAVAERVPDEDDALAAGIDLSVRAMGMSAAEMTPISELTRACRQQAGGDANLAQQCRAVAERMFDRSDTILLRAVGGALYAQATGDPSRRELAHKEQVAIASHWSPGTGLSECGSSRDLLRKFRREARVGELQAIRERLGEPIPP